MTDFATDLLWEETKQPVLPVPGRPHERRHGERPVPRAHAPVVPAETLAERLQRVAGNAVLSREAEEAAATHKRLAAAARHPEQVPAKVPAPKPRDKAETESHKAATDPKKPEPERKKAAEVHAARTAVKLVAQGLPEATKLAAARATALAQVLTSFEHNPERADLVRLAMLVEKAPAGIAAEMARVIAVAVMRAAPAQRAAIAARIRSVLAHRRDLRLLRLLADRLAGFATVAAHVAPPPPPPPGKP